jgi:hypothetical protein
MLICLLLMFALFLPIQVDSALLADSSQSELPTSSLIYISDYVSFLGQDGQGRVAFALDNSRGRDRGDYQAEHLVVLHDERRGWVDLKGNGRYDNNTKDLTTIPASPFFRFQGTSDIGMTIVSDINQLTLLIEPVRQRSDNRHDGAVIRMGTAPAVLTWQGRTIPGRVIYEYFMMPNFNRLTHTYWDMWNEYQGFYLRLGADSDVYLHSQRSEGLAPLMGFLDGFAAISEMTEQLKDLKVEVLERELTWGFYRWPTAWRITWAGPQGPAVLTLKQVTRTSIGNWAIGGFSMVLVRGELDYAGKKQDMYGLVELIM